MSETLHVGNVGDQINDQQLHDLFALSGVVLHARIMTDLKTHAPRGFGLVDMATPEDAQSAIRAIHGHSHGGRTLTVRTLQPRMSGWEGGNDQGGGNRSHGFGTGNGGSRW